MGNRILFIEDSEEMQQAVSDSLKKDCVITLAQTNKEACICLERAEFDLVLLDLTLPDGDGFKICNFIRQTDALRDLPIIFLTGRGEIEDKEMAFSMGADDYLVKPVNSRELKARILGRLRRMKKSRENFVIGDLKFDLSHQKITVFEGKNSVELDTTSLEFRILLYLVNHEGHVFSRNQLMTAIWGEDIHLLERTVDTHISHLRRKLRKAGSGIAIQPVHGAGYRLSAEKKSKKAS